MLGTRVLVSPAAVQLLEAGAGAALWAVPHKDGKEDDGEDLEEEAQPGEPEPRGGGVLRHVVGQLEQPNPLKLGRQEERRAGAGNSACQGGCQVLPSPWCFPRAEEPDGSGTVLPTRKLQTGPLCRGNTRGFLCQQPPRPGARGLGGIWGAGEAAARRYPEFQPLWRFDTGEM